MAVKPAPVWGSKRARRTSSCLSGGRVLRVMRPASMMEAPKPSMRWRVVDLLMEKSGLGGLELSADLNSRVGLAVSLSPEFEETQTFTCWAWVREGEATRR